MRRFALIIGSPGEPADNSIYAGVESDTKNFIKFLMSPSGGGWHRQNEILHLKNPDKTKVKAIIEKLNFDYTLIYFSGHGRHSTQTNESYLVLNTNDEISAKELISSSSKQLIISDICRVPSDDEVFSNFVTEDVEFPSALNITSSRSLFDAHLRNCENGIGFIYSCSVGEKSLALPYGSFYTLSLLNSSQDWTTNIDKYNVLPIEVAFSNSINYYDRSFSHRNLQTPRSNGILQFPFAIKLNQIL